MADQQEKKEAVPAPASPVQKDIFLEHFLCLIRCQVLK